MMESESEEEKILYKPHAETKVGTLTRQRAIRRRANNSHQTLSRGEKDEGHEEDQTEPPGEGQTEPPGEGQGGTSSKPRTSDGSSLDLAPTLLHIYDKIAAGDDTRETQSMEHMEVHSKSMSLPASVAVRHSAVTRTDSDTKLTGTDTKMADKKSAALDSVDADVGKKRPLSISSSSSASSSSLSRPQRKRPNLTEYEHLLSPRIKDITKMEDLNGNCEHMDTSEATVSEPNNNRLCVESVPGSTQDVPGINQSVSAPVSPAPTSSSPDSTPQKHPLAPSHSSPPENSPTKPKTGQVPSPTCSPPSSQSAPTHSQRNGKSSPKSPVGGGKEGETSKGSLYVSYVQRVVAEIVETERLYVRSLEDIIEGYLEYLERSCRVKQDDISCLFSNIRHIYDFSRLFLWELEQCGGDPLKVAQCFVTNNKGFVIYTDYCTNYPRLLQDVPKNGEKGLTSSQSAVEVLTRYMMDPELSEIFKQRQTSLGHGLPLGAYLLRPVQRILKYHLLLQNILKFFEKEKDGHETLSKAFKHMTEMAHHINEMKRKHEHAVRIQEIQSQLEDYAGDDLTRLGELVLEGPFRVYGAKASRQVFLFEREIIISKKKEGGMLGCKSSIQIANLMLVEVIPNEPLSFHLIPFDNPRAQFTLQARNMEQKRRWCQEIKRLILDTYKGKIPDKVKSLVMELGRNHDDDYVNSENLDPRRSHHTAPEYLEKRRGRRKSGGRIPDLLKPQKAKRGSSGNRKGDVSPKTSPLMERRQTHPTLLPSQQRERTPSYKSQHSVNEASEEMSVSEGTRQSAIDDLIQTTDGEEDKASTDRVRRAKSFRLATRMRPINSLDMSDVIQPDDKQEMDTDVNAGVAEVGLKESSDVVFGTQSDFDELSDDEKPRKSSKHSRYASMPVLNLTPPQSPNVKGDQNKSKHSETVHVNTPWKQNKQNGRTNAQPKRWNINKSDKNKSIPAFHDTFSKKSRDKLAGRTLCHPVYSMQHLAVDSDSLSKKGSNARLTNWASSEKLTKGSMTDVSHLSEDPWVKNPDAKELSSSTSTSSVSLKPSRPRLGSNSESHDHKCGSREKIDWMVYVNRNSLNEAENQKYLSKYCNTTVGAMTPPKSPTVLKPDVHRRNEDSSKNQSRPVSTYDTVPDIPKVSLASSVPSIVVSSSTPRFQHHKHISSHLNRSNSTPITRVMTQSVTKRPQSFDCDTLTDSEKMVAEMEDYMKHSESNSSLTYKFPTKLPAFSDNNKGNRNSTISTSSYDSHSSSSSEGIMDTIKHKLHNLTSRKSCRHEDSDTLSAMSSVSDVRPSSLVLSDEERVEGRGAASSSETLDSSHHQSSLQSQQSLLDGDEELRSFLRQRGLGGESIGTRMANSLPPNVEALISEKLRPHSACVLRDNESVSSYELSSKETTPEPQPRLSLPIIPPNVDHVHPVPLDKMDVRQSDSGFSMQSDLTDTSSLGTRAVLEDTSSSSSPPCEQTEEHNPPAGIAQQQSTQLTSPVTRRRTQSDSSADSVDSFYERRLSVALDSDVFRDSAVFCEMDNHPGQNIIKEIPKRPRRSIRDFVQILEERYRPKRPATVEVKRREPGSVIRQRLHTLQQASQYSRSSSRNTSEEREVMPPKSVRDLQHSLVCERAGGRCWSTGGSGSNMASINSSSNTSLSSTCSTGAFPSGVSGPHYAVVGGGNQFMHHRAESEHGRESSPEMGGMRSARSLGRLDQLSNEIENLVIMKGWVRSLINKFQSDKE